MEANLRNRRLSGQAQAGMSLLETMIALALLLIVTTGILTMGAVAMSTTENQGHLAARTTEYAQDKMEQLMSLSYGDPSTDTTTFPSPSTGGSGLTVGGSSDPTAPVTSPGTGYVDYLDATGQPTTSTGNWFYVRVWQISSYATNVKQITVTAKVRGDVAAPGGRLPQSTLMSLKSSPF